ncbi:MAG TPA: hypothetical protein VEJ87_08075, partial [Acidimicrobiales bacterium]|nr:hypothetical protein [Acidimicrobiales bacterium]
MENNSGGFRGWLRLGPDGFDYVVDALAIYASTEIWVPTDDGSMVQVDSRSCRFASLLMDRSDFRHGAVVRWRAGSSVDDFTMRRNRSDSLDKGSLDTATAVTPSLFKVGSGRPSRHPRFCLMLEYSESGLRNLGNSRPDRPHWIQAVVNKEEIHWLFPLSDNQDPEIRCTAALAWSRSRPGIAAIGDEL